MFEVEHVKNKDVMIIYHANCNDGLTAAWAAYRQVSMHAKSVELAPYKHGQIRPSVKGKVVYILDFSFGRNDMLNMHQDAERLILLDHHASAYEKLNDLDFCIFDMNKSGAGMAWDYFHPGQDRPGLVTHTEKYDLFLHEPYDKTDEYIAYAEMHIKDINMLENIFTLYDFDLKELLEDELYEVGRSYLMARKVKVDRLLKNVVYMDINGREVPVVNTSMYINEVCVELTKTHPIAGCFYMLPDGNFKFSLRSSSAWEETVNEIAESFGGGGHPDAAGFTTDDLFEVI